MSRMIKINCQECTRYHDCPRLKGGEVCYGMRPVSDTPSPASDRAVSNERDAVALLWQEICEQYPQKWLLIEVIKAYSDSRRPVLEQLVVVGVFVDAFTAQKQHQRLHHESPACELYVVHTSQEVLDVIEW